MQPLANFIFFSRWLQAPLYVGLVIAQGYYVYRFFLELNEIFHRPNMSENDAVILILGLIDVVMISNLLIMIIVAGYETFVSRLRVEAHPDCPEWLSHSNPNIMKVKLAMALIGISSIHLLKTFINIEHVELHVALWQSVIHVIFLLSALAMALTGRIMDGTAVHVPPEQDRRTGHDRRGVAQPSLDKEDGASGNQH
ncbi:MAG: TIGR00645 family protein [Magnetococcales bacterium]|nr:TIGR00645 family protein [Magnetococcales bacterium]